MRSTHKEGLSRTAGQHADGASKNGDLTGKGPVRLKSKNVHQLR
jgi:hypothetical protein